MSSRTETRPGRLTDGPRDSRDDVGDERSVSKLPRTVAGGTSSFLEDSKLELGESTCMSFIFRSDPGIRNHRRIYLRHLRPCPRRIYLELCQAHSGRERPTPNVQRDLRNGFDVLESACRYSFEMDTLRKNFGCDFVRTRFFASTRLSAASFCVLLPLRQLALVSSRFTGK